MAQPFLSVIIPIWNAEKYLDQCISSILNQTFRDQEIILVDDGSTDKSPGICDKYAQSDARIRVIHQANKGSVNARLTGAKSARGTYITFADADDWIEPEMYAVMKSLIDENHADILITECYRDMNGSLVRCRNEVSEGFYEGESLLRLQKEMLFSGKFYHAGIAPNLFNKWFLRNLLVPNMEPVDARISYGDDMACVYPAILDARSVYVYKKQCFYHYRYNQDSITEKEDPAYFRKHNYLYPYLEQSFNKRNRADLTELLQYHRAYVLVWGIVRRAGSLRLKTSERVRTLKKIFSDPEFASFLEELDFSMIKIPFPYRQLIPIVQKRRLYSTAVWAVFVKIWMHFFW